MVITPSALEALVEASQPPDHFLALHASGVWGDLDREDCAANDRAIANEGDLDGQDRVFSSYKISCGVKLWVITEWDRSVRPLVGTQSDAERCSNRVIIKLGTKIRDAGIGCVGIVKMKKVERH